MSTHSQATESQDFMVRLHRVLSSAQLDCECRTALDGMLDRFSTLECRRQLRKDLRDARRRRDQIATLLSFLKELDEITEREVDHTVFDEMASLFDEISTSAAEAAETLREVDVLLHPGIGEDPATQVR